MNPSSFNIHPDARARMRLLTEMLENSARRGRTKSILNSQLSPQSDEPKQEKGADESAEVS